MTIDPAEPGKLPDWVREALTDGEPTDDVPNKRAESRHHWTLFCSAEVVGESAASSFPVRIFNASPQGIGLIVREEIAAGLCLRIRPDGAADDAAAYVRVVHCTQTIQGYKLGCTFEQE